MMPSSDIGMSASIFAPETVVGSCQALLAGTHSVKGLRVGLWVWHLSDFSGATDEGRVAVETVARSRQPDFDQQQQSSPSPGPEAGILPMARPARADPLPWRRALGFPLSKSRTQQEDERAMPDNAPMTISWSARVRPARWSASRLSESGAIACCVEAGTKGSDHFWQGCRSAPPR